MATATKTAPTTATQLRPLGDRVVIQPTARVQASGMEARAKAGVTAKVDTTQASRRLETSRAPGKKKPGLKPASAPKSSTTKKTTSGTHSHAQ